MREPSSQTASRTSEVAKKISGACRPEYLLAMVASMRADQGAQLFLVFDEKRRFLYIDGARAWKVYGQVQRHPAGARRHEDDAVGQKYGLGNAVRDQDGGFAGTRPDVLQVQVHLVARQRIQGTER